MDLRQSLLLTLNTKKMRTKKFAYVLLAGAFALSLFTSNVMAGDNGRFSIGANLGLPTGDDANVYSMSIGGSLRYELPVGDNLGITGTVGYNSYLLKSEFDGTGLSLSSIPILLGAKYYFQEQQNGFYGMVQLGVTSTTAKVDLGGVSVSASSTDLTFGPAIGYHLANLDFGAAYDIISASGSSSGIIDIRIAYVLGEK